MIYKKGQMEYWLKIALYLIVFVLVMYIVSQIFSEQLSGITGGGT